MKIRQKRSRGFTIIEITLVMAFVSLLLMAVVMVTVYFGKIYTKGITLKSLNQSGRDISDAIRRDMITAEAGRVRLVTTGAGTQQTGRLCLGNVSYLWNNAALLQAGSSVPKIKKASDGSVVQLVRVVDPTGKYCTATSGSYLMNVPDVDAPIEYLANEDIDFAIYKVERRAMYAAAGGSKEGLFRIAFTLGTNQAGTTTTAGTETTCKPPSDNTANFDFCSVRDFDLLLRAGGGTL